MDMMNRVKYFSFMIGCFLLTQCLESSYQSSDNRVKILRAISSEIVLARYEEFVISSDTLKKTTADLCADLTEERLEIARQSWWDARVPWKRAEVVTFGPTFDYPHRLKFRIDDWPASDDFIEELIVSDQELTPDEFTRLGTDHRGLPVVEYLLWSTGDQASTLLALGEDSRRCDALVGVSADVHANAVKLATLWGDEWIDLVINDGDEEESKFEDAQELIVEWVNRLAFTVENIRNKKFEKPLGDLTPEDVRPDVIESHLSGRSIQDARDALLGVSEIWRGSGEEDKMNGLKYLITDRRVVSQIDQLFDEATEALDQLEGPLELLTTHHREKTERAIEAVKTLQMGIQNELADAAEATIRFNDTTDGD
jgi:predicted lipoprotein